MQTSKFPPRDKTLMTKSREISTILSAKCRDPSIFSGAVSSEMLDIVARMWCDHSKWRQTYNQRCLLLMYANIIKWGGGQNNLHFSFKRNKDFSMIYDIGLCCFSSFFARIRLNNLQNATLRPLEMTFSRKLVRLPLYVFKSETCSMNTI